MKLKYYSEKLNKFYDSAEECQHAEFEAKEAENRVKIQKEREERELKEKKEKALAERKTDAENVENARKAYFDAQKKYHEELKKFIGKYGTYHYSTRNPNEVPTLFDFVNDLFSL